MSLEFQENPIVSYKIERDDKDTIRMFLRKDSSPTLDRLPATGQSLF